ncbi:MAG: SUF system NifU family Fe-S cluster assembly protein [Deltaproteobacteria bacterium]|nr:MAG: SUF system NifU family Fe-S cluster assembly protein [Deltaproteobacteria bacterium]
MNELYQNLILDHNKNPKNYGSILVPTHTIVEFNPFCGDEIKIYLIIKGVIMQDIKFESCGCAISKASASLMCEEVKSKKISDIFALIEMFLSMLSGNTKSSSLNFKLNAFSNINKYPNRIKCASLAWHALQKAIEEGQLK